MGNIAGVVLAGGQSSRMGVDKAFLRYRGRPLIDHMMALVRAAGVRDIWVGGDLDGYQCLPDNIPHAGPAVAMRDMLRSLSRYDAVLFVPVDMPLLTPELLRLLLHHGGGACFERSPLPVVFPTKEVVGRVYSVRDLNRALGIAELALPDGAERCLLNVNTPEDWREITG